MVNVKRNSWKRYACYTDADRPPGSSAPRDSWDLAPRLPILAGARGKETCSIPQAIIRAFVVIFLRIFRGFYCGTDRPECPRNVERVDAEALRDVQRVLSVQKDCLPLMRLLEIEEEMGNENVGKPDQGETGSSIPTVDGKLSCSLIDYVRRRETLYECGLRVW